MDATVTTVTSGTGTNGTTNTAAPETPPTKTTPPAEGTTPPAAPESVEWDAYIAKQEAPVRAAYEAHTTGLKSALVKERESAKALAKALKDAQTGTAEEQNAKLAELTAQLGETQRRLGFVTSPEAAEVIDADIAYTVAAAKGMFDAKGQPKWADLKAAFPAMFKQPKAPQAPDINGGARGGGNGGVPTYNGQPLEAIANKYGLKMPRK